MAPFLFDPLARGLADQLLWRRSSEPPAYEDN